MNSPKNILKLLGPGLLFAGAAVGVSHLVYSTRAGANYGFGLIWLVLLTNILKYPFFEFGPRYAAATGQSLLQGYQKLGTPVLALFGVITIGTMFTIIAAVSLVTASLAINLFGITTNTMIWVAIILIICMALLLIGRYNLLDHLMKIIILTLTIITLITVVIAFGKSSQPISWSQQFTFDTPGLIFIIAFMGWMPAPLDLSVWHSLWTIEKRKQNDGDFNSKQSLVDFNIGYIGTMILALFFVSLGALMMYQSGEEFSDKAPVFASQLIDLYTQTLGGSIGLFVSLAAFITMFSTTITCLDALPRSMVQTQQLLLNQEESDSKKSYIGWMLLLIVGALIILNLLMTNMGTFLMIATILSFITAPFFAIANYILVTKHLPIEDQPSKAMRILSGLGIIYLIGFCLIYIQTYFYS